MDLLIHGVHDAQTLQFILSKNSSRVGFDLRGRSLNLIPFGVLRDLLKELKGASFHLIFENDKDSTILSFLDLLKEHREQVILEFRDQLAAEFYKKLNHPFFWCFHPEGDWKSILEVSTLQGIILPTEWKSFYRTYPALWDIIERRHLEVFIHAATVSELESLVSEKNLKLSFDLGQEFYSSFRRVDQEKLSGLKVWRMRNENPAIQR